MHLKDTHIYDFTRHLQDTVLNEIIDIFWP